MSKDINTIISNFHDCGLYLPTRSVDISGDVDLEMYQKTLRNLHILDSMNGTINVFIHSEGGDLTYCKAIYDLIKGCRNYVRGMVYGEASSSASIFFQACDERLMAPNAELMIHIGEEATGGHPENKARWDAKYKRDGVWMQDVYLEKIKQIKPRYTRKRLTDLLRFDTILSAKEAIELGLCDRIEDKFTVEK